VAGPSFHDSDMRTTFKIVRAISGRAGRVAQACVETAAKPALSEAEGAVDAAQGYRAASPPRLAAPQFMWGQPPSAVHAAQEWAARFGSCIGTAWPQG